MFEIIESQRGGRKMVNEGFVYFLHRSDDTKTTWRCSEFQKGCRGRAFTRVEEFFLTKEHNHAPDVTKVQQTKLSATIRHAARNSTAAPRRIVNESLVGVSENTLVHMPQMRALQNKVTRARRQVNLNFVIPHTLADVNIPENIRFTKTNFPEDFLLVDSGVEDPRRIIIFSSRTDILRLSACTAWMADATFKMAPEMFAELWIIHGVYQNRSLPLVYCLLPDKTENSYTRALNFIFQKIDLLNLECPRPTSITIDFEKSEENAFRAVIRGINVHGCYFHFAQAFWRKIQQLGMQVRYVQDENYASVLKSFCALAFCNICDIPQRYNALAQSLMDNFGAIDQHSDFLEYMENTWIGRQRRNPRFQLEMWNCKTITELNLPRTNNSVESAHKSLQQCFRYQHPTIYKLLDALLLENVRVNAICVRLDAGEVVPLYSRREYELSNQRLLHIIGRYNEYEDLAYLRACAHYVAF